MGLLDRFRNKSTFKLITENNGDFIINGSRYKNDIILSCIRPKSKAISKLIPKVKGEGDSSYLDLLLKDPNPLMGFSVLIEKSINQLQLNGNSFILITRDKFNMPNGLYPIDSHSVEAIIKENGLYLKFILLNGKTFEVDYQNIIHIRQDFMRNTVFGESKVDILKPLLEVIETTDQGLIKAIKNGNSIKWLLKFNQSLRKEDIISYTEDFISSFLNQDTAIGNVASVDSKAEATQIKPNDYVPNVHQTSNTIKRIYNIFNINENIIQSKYTEEEWNSFYESEIEPLSIQLSEEFTRKLLSKKERLKGYKVVFESANLQYANLSTKISLVQMVDRGALTPNEWRLILNLGTIEGGDKPIRRLDTAIIESTKSKGDKNEGD